MAKIPLDLKQMRKFRLVILGRIDDVAEKQKTAKQIQVAMNKAIAASKAGDEATVTKVFTNLQNAAKNKKAPKKVVEEVSKAAPAKKASATPRLDKIAEGAKPMDEAMRTGTKADALEKMSKGDDVMGEDEYADWASRTRGEDVREDELLDFSEEGDFSTPAEKFKEVAVTKESRKQAAEATSADLEKNERRAYAIMQKRREELAVQEAQEKTRKLVKRGKEQGVEVTKEDIRRYYKTIIDSYELPEAEQKAIIDRVTAEGEKRIVKGSAGELTDEKKFVSARRFTSKQRKAIANRNKNLKRGGKPEMTAEEEDAFVAELKNPKGEVRRFKTMPQAEEKNLPEPKTKRETFRGKQEGESFAESLKKTAPKTKRKRVKKAPIARVSEGLRTKAQSMGRKAREANKGKDPSGDKAFTAFVEAQRPKRPELRGIAQEDPRRLMAWKQAVKEFEDMKNELRKEWLNGWNT